MKISIICRKDKYLPELADIGYDGVDIPVGDFNRLLDKEYADQIHNTYRIARDCGLVFSQTHLPFWAAHYAPIGDGSFSAYEEFMLPRLIRAIELTADANCRTAVLHPFFTSNRKESVDGNMLLIEHLIPTLEKTGVILSLENIYNNDLEDAFATTPEDFLQYIDHFKHPLLGVCLDAGHAVILRQDPNEMLEVLKPHLTALHLHSVTFDNDLHTVPGLTGGVNWHRFMEQLNDSNYKGTFNMEVKPPDYNDHLVKCFNRFAYEVASEIVNGKF